MGGFIDGLNKNAGAVQAVFAGVVALATLIYVALTGGMWREMRLTNRRMVRPNVQVVFGHGPNAWPDYRVSVENIGNVPVYDVRITADPPDLALFHLGPPFGTAIPVLAERVKLETCLPVYVGDFDKIPDGTRLTFTATYQLADGKPAPVQRFSYDMDLYKRLLSPRVQNVNDHVILPGS